MKYLIFLLILFGGATQASAQNIIDYDAYLSNLENSGNSQMIKEGILLRGLYEGPGNTIYLNENSTTTHGTGSLLRFITNINDLDSEMASNVNFSNVEMMTVLVRQESDITPAVLRQEYFTKMPKLRYVVFISEFGSPLTVFSSIVEGNPGAVKLMRKIAITH